MSAVGAEGSLVTSFSSFPRRLAFGFLLALCLGLGVSPGAGYTAEYGPDFIPLDEIKPGMTGYGLTVFEGARIDTFGVRVVGVQDNIRADGSLLLVEVSGHGLELSSIAQGMSGSPVFVEGRFAGALAFGWGGALKPLAGVTPAAEILALPTDVPVTPAAESHGLSPDLLDLLAPGSTGRTLARDLYPETVSATQVIGGSDVYYSSTETHQDWPTPRELIMTLLEDLTGSGPGSLPGPGSWIVQPVGSGSQDSGNDTSAEAAGPVFRPGSACAVPLITGDAKLGVIGTVTWVDGDQVFMMGHPFMQRGQVDWPLATAKVLTVFPSRQMSFKVASVGRIVGTVHHDQRAGLSGRTGPSPDMVPVSIELNLPVDQGHGKRSYEFAVVSDKRLTPTLVFWALYNSLLVEGDDASLQNLSYRIETVWEGPAELADQPLVLSGVVAGPGGAMALAAEWVAPLNILLNNPYHEVRLKEVRARLEQTRPMAAATIVGLTGPRVLRSAGEEVVFRVEIQPRFGGREFIEVPFTVPAHLEPGPLRVLAASAADLFAFEAERAPGRFQVAQLGNILEILRTGRSADTLALAIMSPGQSRVLQGQEMHSLPGSVSNLIETGNMQATRTLADYVLRRDLPTKWVLSGHAVRALHLNPAPEPITEERRP
jgi:hypothetical protein